MSITKISSLCSLLCLALSAAVASAQGGGTAQRVLTSITPQGLQLHIEESALGGSGGGLYTTASTTLVWRYESDGTWLADNASLGDHGAQVFTQFGSFVNHAALFSAFGGEPANPAWSDDEQIQNFARSVSSSAEAGVHVALHQEFADDLEIVRNAVLRKYTSSSVDPDWTYTSAIPIINHEHIAAEVSRDGTTIALLVHDSSTNHARLAVFGADSSTPIIDEEIDTFGPFESIRLSDDGSTLLIANNQKLVTFDIYTASVIYQDFIYATPQYGALALSGDGSLLATGTLGEFEVLQREGLGNYTVLVTQELQHPYYCRRLAFSRDGSTVVAGLHRLGDKNTARFMALDLDGTTPEVLLDTEFVGAGTHDNLVEEIQCSDDGKRFAIGLWGDEEGLVPEVLVFRRDLPEPIAFDDLPGSVMDLDFSSDGRWLAIASKSVHANEWGGGGAISLYQAGFVDLTLAGLPTPGGTVQVEHHLREGSGSEIFIATSLADSPIEDHGYGGGILYLDPTTMTVLGSGNADESNVFGSSWPIPDGPSEVGKVYYLQAADFLSDRLSANYLKVTVLP